MKGQITKITEPYQSYNSDTDYWVIAFRMADGGSARTFTCKKYNNFKKWKKMMVKGNWIDGLRWKEGCNGVLDADYGRPYQDPLPNLQLPIEEKESLAHCLGL